jgi:hypothetical protein
MKYLLIIVACFIAGYVLGTSILKGQTQLSLNTQVSPLPAIVVQSWATCVAPCSGLMLANIQVNGVSGSYIVMPSGPTVSSEWVNQPVTIAKGTGVTCLQVKP